MIHLCHSGGGDFFISYFNWYGRSDHVAIYM